MNDGEGEE